MLLKGLMTAEGPVTGLAVGGRAMSWRVPNMLLESLVTAKAAITGLAIEG